MPVRLRVRSGVEGFALVRFAPRLAAAVRLRVLRRNDSYCGAPVGACVLPRLEVQVGPQRTLRFLSPVSSRVATPAGFRRPTLAATWPRLPSVTVLGQPRDTIRNPVKAPVMSLPRLVARGCASGLRTRDEFRVASVEVGHWLSRQALPARRPGNRLPSDG